MLNKLTNFNIPKLMRLIKNKSFSYYVSDKKVEGDDVDVLVVGILEEGVLLKKRRIATEWVRINAKDLAHVFCIEKYGRDCRETTLRFRREYLRAKLFATRYAVGVALKRILRNFLETDYRDRYEEEAEAVELSVIYERLKVDPATDAQKKLIHTLLKEKGITDEEYRKLLREKFGVGSSLELTKEEATELIEILKEVKK